MDRQDWSQKIQPVTLSNETRGINSCYDNEESAIVFFFRLRFCCLKMLKLLQKAERRLIINKNNVYYNTTIYITNYIIRTL